jgi:hypothetical protein
MNDSQLPPRMCCDQSGPFRHQGCRAQPTWRNVAGVGLETGLIKINNLLALGKGFFTALAYTVLSQERFPALRPKSAIRLLFLSLEHWFFYLLPRKHFAAVQDAVFFKILLSFIERKAFSLNNIKFVNFSSHHRFFEAAKFLSFLPRSFLFSFFVAEYAGSLRESLALLQDSFLIWDVVSVVSWELLQTVLLFFM